MILLADSDDPGPDDTFSHDVRPIFEFHWIVQLI